MSDAIKRFDLFTYPDDQGSFSCMEEDPCGDWVIFADHEAAIAAARAEGRREGLLEAAGIAKRLSADAESASRGKGIAVPQGRAFEMVRDTATTLEKAIRAAAEVSP
jgi:hypothetical protein